MFAKLYYLSSSSHALANNLLNFKQQAMDYKGEAFFAIPIDCWENFFWT